MNNEEKLERLEDQLRLWLLGGLIAICGFAVLGYEVGLLSAVCR